MITISVCMIVKNEEAILARCLDCIMELSDEIIIVDTGSTDNTKKVAAEYTDKIYDYTWHDDFAAARNFAISKASMEYIYMADADEVVDPKNQMRLLLLKEALLPEIDVVQVKYSNQLSHGTVYNFDTEYRPKLFRRIQTFQYVDPIHEKLKVDACCYDSDVVIKHMPRGSHGSRDLKFFRKITADGFLSARLNHMYAMELFLVGKEKDFRQAEDYFIRVYKDDYSNTDLKKDAASVLARCAALRGADNELLQWAAFAVAGEVRAEAACEIGDYYIKKQELQNAHLWYKMAYEYGESGLNIHYSGDIPLSKIANCYAIAGNIEDAKLYQRRAKEWTVPEYQD